MSTEVGGHSTKVPSAWMRKRTVAGQKPPHRSRNQALNPGQSGTRYDAPKRAKNAELRNKAHSQEHCGQSQPEPPPEHSRVDHLRSRSTGSLMSVTRKYLASEGCFLTTSSYIA